MAATDTDRAAAGASTAGPTTEANAWAPLRAPLFRRLWLAQMVSNLGTWIQMVGAQWLIVSVAGSAALVGLVQTASTLPAVLLAAPAGVLADVLDRRRVLVTVQLSMVVVAGVLAVLTFTGLAHSGVVLGFTFLLGCGAAFIGPAWQAIQPDLVPRRQIPQAAALGAVNMNLARAIGPAIGGVLVAAAGAGFAFTLNAVSFLVVAGAVASWRREVQPESIQRERMVSALRSGARYVWNAPAMRRVLERSVLFVPAASALWALLPVEASKGLGLGANGYGLLLAALGIGAVSGAFVLPVLRRRMSADTVIGIFFVTYAVALVGVALVHQLVVVLLLLAVCGLAWMAVLSTLNATAQIVLPGWVRARALSYYLVAFMAGQALGGVVWGTVAAHTGVTTAFLAAAALLVVSAVAARRVPLVDPGRLDPRPSTHWPTPQLREPVEPDAGPVLVLIEYDVRGGEETAFEEAMRVVARSRRRTGAQRWHLYADPTQPGRFVESFTVGTWDEHERQHGGRLTVYDRRAEEAAHAHLTCPPSVQHLVATGTG